MKFQHETYQCRMYSRKLLMMGRDVRNIKNFIIIIGIQTLGRSGQRPELSQATGMALVRCILGKFLGVVCHCFSPRLDVRTFTTRCPHVRHDARDPSGGRWNCGREYCPVILLKWRLPRHLGIFYMPQISEGRRAEDFFAFKNPTASAGFEPANLGTKGQHATPRPPKPLSIVHNTFLKAKN
jgi:hypothetical protein